MDKIAVYFKKVMHGNPDPRTLQQIVLFHIIYYLCRRGRENLCRVNISTFALAINTATNRVYVYISKSWRGRQEPHTTIAN